MGRVQTSVMIDEDKRELAKLRGLKLQDLLDDALNMALELEIPGKAQLEIDKSNILRDIELKEKEKELYLEKYERDINELNLKLKFIEQKLDNASEEQSQLNKLNEYKDIITRAVKEANITEELNAELIEFCVKYKMFNIQGVYEQAVKDLNSIFYKKLTIDDITLDYDIFKPFEGADEWATY